MGQFIIAAAKHSARIDECDRQLSRHGFNKTLDAKIGVHRVVLHARLNGSVNQPVRIQGGGLAAHTGSLLFDGKIGEAALRGLYEAFDPDDPPWHRCRGHYAAIIAKDNRLWLMTDRMGSYHIYHDEAFELCSSSFVAVLESISSPRLNAAGVFEYAWNECTFGDDTVFEQVRRLVAPAVVSFDHKVSTTLMGPAIDVDASPPANNLEEVAAAQCEKLEHVFRDYRGLLPRPFSTALSGGYDSRLILGCLRNAGIDPSLFVFGASDDPDVQVAKKIADGERLKLRHLDKQGVDPVTPQNFAAQVERDLYAFDGIKNVGLFDSGADFADRQERQSGDGVVINGSLGEIYRNFFCLWDRSMSLRELVWAFFSQFDPRAMTDRFSVADYEDRLIAKMEAVLGTSAASVERSVIEALYPLFRGRFWSSSDTSVNQRFGWMLFPFLEPDVIEETNAIPISMKNFGLLEAAMIRQVSPSLAGYQSIYGYPFSEPPQLRSRARLLASYCRPPWLRRYSYRWKHKRHSPRPIWLSQSYLVSILDNDAPYMRALFNLDRIADPGVYNRIMTVEYLCQRYHAEDIT